MSDEESAKKMEFILEQQAQFTAKIGQLEDIVTRLANASFNRFEDLEEKMVALVDSQVRLADSSSKRFEDAEEKIVALVDSQVRLTEAQDRLTEAQDRLTESQDRLNESQDRLTEAQALTDENVKNLIAVADRYFNENRNGKP